MMTPLFLFFSGFGCFWESKTKANNNGRNLPDVNGLIVAETSVFSLMTSLSSQNAIREAQTKIRELRPNATMAIGGLLPLAFASEFSKPFTMGFRVLVTFLHSFGLKKTVKVQQNFQCLDDEPNFSLN